MRIRRRRTFVWLAAVCVAFAMAGSAGAGETAVEPVDGRTWTAPAAP